MVLSASRCRKNLFRNIKYDDTGSIFKSNNLQPYEKEYWKLSGYERIIREYHQNCLFYKKEILAANEALARGNGKICCKNRVLVTAVIPLLISKETVCRVLGKTNMKWIHFQRKRIMSKNDLKLRIKFARKVYHKRATCRVQQWNMKSSESYDTRESGN